MKIPWYLILCFIMCGTFDLSKSIIQGSSEEKCSFLKSECDFNVYCQSYFDITLEMIYQDTNENDNCENKIQITNRMYLPINVFLSGDEPNPFPEINHDYDAYYDGVLYFQSPNVLIQFVDFNYIGYDILPDISTLIHLKKLHASNNQLAVATLSNNENLDFLEEIDFSFNNIETIEVLENQQPYNGLKILNLSHNLITDIAHLIFYKFVHIENLDLSNNTIKNLNIATFLGLNNILSINLGNNLIENLDSSLANLSTLEELYLQENKITKVLYKDLHSLINLKIVDLSNNKITIVESEVFNNMTYLTSLNLRNNYVKILDRNMFFYVRDLYSIDFSGNQIRKFPNYMFREKNITFFSIAGNNIEYLSKGIFDGLHLVTKLNMSFQGVTSIDDYAFYGAENISELLLNNNKINTISEKAFTFLKYLLHLDLSHNNIRNITFDLEDLISLRFLNLTFNKITHITRNDLQKNIELEFLDLSNNEITTIEAFSFKFLAYLKSLQISNNPLQGYLAQNTFNGLQDVPSLDLSYNSLTIICNESFSGMINISNINISHGTLREVHYNSFINTGNIVDIDISFNNLTYFDINVTHLTNLKTLMLNNNLIKILSVDFSNVVHLKTFDLSYNDLSFSLDKLLSKQIDIEYLDLSHNLNLVINISIIRSLVKLKTLHLSSTKANIAFTWNESQITELEIANICIQNITKLNLSKLNYLSNLVLSNNKVTKLLAGTFTNMSNLYSLDMSYNKIMYLQPGLFKDCHSLYMLNVSHNLLININYGALRGVPGLGIIDISYNFIENLESERFYETKGLIELIADHNNIHDVTVEDFQGQNLKKLSIGSNPLPCKSLIRLNKMYPIFITAITLDEISDHNYHGVTCSGNDEEVIENRGNKTVNIDTNLKMLMDIRNILRNIQNSTIQKDESKDFTSAKGIIGNISIDIKQQTLKTNSLLERILKVMEAKNSIHPLVHSKPWPVTDNQSKLTVSFKDLNDLENNLMIDKKKILAEIDDKILQLSERINWTKSDDVKQNSSFKSTTFTEVCIVIILLILLSSIGYFIYKSKLNYVGNRSLSTRQMTEDMENANL